MKATQILFLTALFLILFHSLKAQSGSESTGEFTLGQLEKLVVENNPSLKTERLRMEVALLEAKTGNTPPDPEIELGYLAGKPEETGNRMDFSVTQSFDFPTNYIHRSQLKEEKTSRAIISYEISRQDVLLQTRKLWIMGVVLNKQIELLGRRLENAKTLQEHFRLKLEAGEEGALSLSQARLQRVALQTKYEDLALGIKKNQLKLDLLTGGSSPKITSSTLPPGNILNRDSLLQDYRKSPEMQYLQRNLAIKEQQKKLAQSTNLPKFSAGYYSETVIDQQFRGVHVGLSIPLWENSNSIKLAKSEVIYAESNAGRFAAVQQEELFRKLEEQASLEKQINSLDSALSMVNDDELLLLSLKSGEVSLAEYIYSSEFYFQNLMQLLELKREKLLVEAELMKIYL